MKLRLLCAICALMLPLAGIAQTKVRPRVYSGPRNEIVAGQLLVKVRLAKGQLDAGPISIPELPEGSTFHNSIHHMGWTVWTIPAGVDPRAAAKAAMKNSHVAWAEPVNKVYALINDPNDLDWNVYETETSYPDIFLNFGTSDLSFKRLWHLDDDNAIFAWGLYPNQYYTSSNKPTNAPTIAIIDSGCDLNHPDFMNAGGFSTNTAMGGQLNYSVSNHFSFGEPDGGSWNDDNGHGTHVAGLALASANNLGFSGHGVPGLGYNAQGMILKVIAGDGTGTDTDAAAGIFYAADNNADVINLSLGTTNYSQIFQDATTYAWQKGCLVVAAGNENGNGGGNLGPIYPAACSGALGVTANAPDYFSADDYYAGYGDYVDIAAPGGDVVTGADYYIIQYVWSTMPTTYFYLSDHNDGSPPYIEYNYTYLAGTSMATPQVSGAAALYYGMNNLRRAQGHVNMRVYRALEYSAFGAAGATNGSWEPTQGYGCLDAYALLLNFNQNGSTVGSAEGIVYDGGTPVSNVQVRAQRVGSGTYISTTSLADGTYRFDQLLPGTYTLSAAPFGHLKQRKALVIAGSDATGQDFWAEGNPFDATPPDVPIFSVNTVNANSVSLSQWGYDSESGIDSFKVRIGTTVGGQDVYPETEIVTESTAVSITGLALNSNTSYYLRATYTNGSGMTTVIDRTISFSAASVSGTVTLQNYTGPMPVVTITVRAPGSTTALYTYNITPAANGSYSFTAPPPGTYDIGFKASHWLRQVIHNVVVTGSGAAGVNPSLINGDVNGDNTISLGDFAALRSAYGSSSGSSNWNPNADLNGDGSVGLGDFAILRSHYGQSGDG